jgi:diguanylate cyclase (GGDEF)-like protein
MSFAQQNDDVVPPNDALPYESVENAEGTSPSRILVVDDEPDLRETITAILVHEGYAVETASDGEEALGLVQTSSYDLVLSDLDMPKLDGIELLTQMKDLPHCPEVIIITGHASIESAVQAIKLGAADYIPKPLNFDLLRLVVSKTIAQRKLKRQAAEVELYKLLSRLDGLTEVYNHRFFHQILAAELARADRFHRPLSLLMIDADYFKEYNDTHGHQAGDEALKKLTWIFKRFRRTYDSVARYGGEEFAIILPETNKETAIVVGERIRKEVLATSFPGEETLPTQHLTISLGLATYPLDAASKDALIKIADTALYKAKKLGKNRLYYFSETIPP